MGYHDARNPISSTTMRIKRISEKTTCTGYADTIKEPAPGKVIIPNLI